MFRKSKLYIVAAFVLLTALLTGCAGAQATPEVTPTIDPQPTYAFVQTQAVQTAIAEMTLNAPTATPTLEPTATLQPTATLAPTQVLPTATATYRPITASATATGTPVAMGCTVTEQSPANGTDLKPGADFDARWTVKNTGSQTWAADSMDFSYVTGQTKMHTGGDTLDLKQDVPSGGTYTIVLDMTAPSNSGTYTTSWALVGGGSGTLCTLSVSIDVVP
ncbi:MAG TPA: NBR1-Ig-like domain-containing protein [Anaerolineaceae bacterium]|nr:NBR1-Ig-like domain-containing protein [Anaerolineaceae bacterium]